MTTYLSDFHSATECDGLPISEGVEAVTVEEHRMNWWKLAQSQSDSVTLDLSDGYHTAKIGDATIIYHVFAPGNYHFPEGHVEVSSLRVPGKLRGTGEARRAMRVFTAALDRSGLASSLGASPLDKKTKLPRLVDFYRSHGYQPTGKSVNPLGHPVMSRPAVRTQEDTKLSQYKPEMPLFHGTSASFDKLKPNAQGIIWVTPDMTVAQQYAAPTYAKGQPRVFKVTLKPNARVVNLRNVQDPTIRQLRDAFNAIRKVTVGSEISEEQWPQWADFGMLEVSNGQWTRWLKSKRITAVTCSDSVLTSATPHESVAVLSPSAIDLQTVEQ